MSREVERPRVAGGAVAAPARARRPLLALGGAALLLLAILPALAGRAQSPGEEESVAAAGHEVAIPIEVTSEERAVAIGLLLDMPRSPRVTEEAIVLAEKLRRRYGIQSGDDFADREAATRRAQEEFLDRLVFTEKELVAKARALGYRLEPAECANYCENVRELARIELTRAALEALADGRPWPGRLAETSEQAALQREIAAAEPSEDPED